MKVFISDLHISSPLFKLENEVIDLFNNTRVDSVYILGDLFDTWEQKIEKTLEKRASLINVINNSGKTEVILKGNHDPTIEVLCDIFPNVFISDSYRTKLFGKDILMVHGDEFDGAAFWGKILFPPQWFLERVIRFNSKAWLRKIIYKSILWVKNVEHKSLVLKMEKKLVEKYAHDFDIIMAAHSHIAKIVSIPDVIYINCGALMGDTTYVVAEGNTLEIKRF